MRQLPVELRRLCIDPLDDDADTLKQLRLVNKDLGTLATEVLFGTAVLRSTDESAEAFDKLVRSKYSKTIRRVVIYTDTEEDDPQDESEILESFAETIALLSSLENLQELQLKFAVDCAAELDTYIGEGYFEDVNQTPKYRSQVLRIVFDALKDISTLKVLSIRNLQDHMDRQILEFDAFQSVRGRLTGLHLQIVTEVREQHDLDFAALHQGFTVDLPELWLRPVSPHLTHLTLYSYTTFWGLYPFVDFRQIETFPCLESLSLGNWTIAHDWQIDWILSHGPTLKQLLLDDCPIIAALKMAGDDNMARLNFPDLQPQGDTWAPYFTLVSLRWYQIFGRFQSDLQRLEHFAMYGSECDWEEDCFDHRYALNTKLRANRYQFFDRGLIPHWPDPPNYGPREQHHEFYRSGRHPNAEHWRVQFPNCDVEDEEALGKLMEAVSRRART